MLKPLILLLIVSAACGGSSSGGAGGAGGLGGMGGTIPIECPDVTTGQDEILEPDDRERMVELCGADCFPFFGEVRRETDGCASPSVDGRLAATCLPIFFGECAAVDLRLELVDCAPNTFLDQDIAVVGGFTECRVHSVDGTIVLTGNTFWPLGEEEWRPCSPDEQQTIFCL